MKPLLNFLIACFVTCAAEAKFENLIWSAPTSVIVSSSQISIDINMQWNGDDASWVNNATVPGQVRILDNNFKIVGLLEVSYGGFIDSLTQGSINVTQSTYTNGHISKDGQFAAKWTIPLNNGTYFIQGYSGFSDGLPIDTAGVRTVSKFGVDPSNNIIKPIIFDINVFQVANPVATSILPSSETIKAGDQATFALNVSGTTPEGAVLYGTDGTNLNRIDSSISLAPSAGSYTYTLSASGTVHLRWSSPPADELWLDPPSGPSVNILNLPFLDVSVGGLYTIRARFGENWTSQPLQVIQPNQAVSTATLIVVAAPANPVVDNPPVAPPTANPQANPPVDPPVSNPPINPVANAAIGPIVTAFSPTVSNYTVTSGLAAGKTYGRCWQNGGVWTAYLGREGVGFQATASSDQGAITAFEIQAKSPSSDWYTLTRATPPAGPSNRTGLPVTQSLSARLGEVNAQKPLIPADETLAGEWRIRARAQDSLGTWSPWAFEQSLTATLPIAVVTKTGQTLPPVEDAAWFTASPAKTYTFNVLVP